MTVHARTAVAIVPVRIGSQRLPKKAMLAESGKPLFLHTFDAAVAAERFAARYVTTDSDEVAAAAEAAGAPVLRTGADCRTGSERCARAAEQLGQEVGIVVDIQGDWPEVAPADLDALVACLESGAAPTATLAARLFDGDPRFEDPNVVKVVRALSGDAMYFSRAPIPHAKEPGAPRLRHVGVYAFTREALRSVPDLPSSGLAETESLEQLRFLENGLCMRVLDATGDPWGIETRADYDAFLERNRARSTNT